MEVLYGKTFNYNWNFKVSWKDAIVQTVAEASKTLDYLTGVKIIEQRAKINGDKISEYYVDLDLSFMLDRERE